MSGSQEFPEELLSHPNDERLSYFKDYTVAHPTLMEVDQRLKKAIREPASKSLIFVYGPTGVGKTTMIRHVEQELLEHYQSSESNEDAHLPLTSLEAPASSSGNFKWKDFYTRTLQSLSEPFVEDKIDLGSGISRNEKNKLVVKRSTTKSALRRSLEKALEHREPQALIIDEAQHLTHMSSGRRLRDQLECLKSLANISETTLVLIGTYDLLAFRNLSGQLSRRSIDIHFPRYRVEDETEADQFKRVIKSFQMNLPLPKPPNFLDDWSFLYERSLGCVGILKDWLTITYSNCLEEGKDAVGVERLTDQALSIAQCEQILKEIETGEQSLSDPDQKRHNLRRKLHLEFDEETDDHQESGGRKTVGVRNPERDSVGVES